MKYYFLSFFILLSACTSVKVFNTEAAPGIDFKSYKTFDFYQLKASGDTISSRFEESINLLEAAITEEMGKRGYTRSSSNPDMLLNIGLVVQEKVETRQTNLLTDPPMYIGQRNYKWESKEVETGRYRMGTMTLDIVDANKNTMIWTGAVEGVIPEKESKVEMTIDKGVGDLFKKYPVAAMPVK